MNKYKLKLLSKSGLKVFLLLVSIVLLNLTAPAYGAKNFKSPASVEPWEEWVMYGNEQYSCPSFYNDQSQFICVWPELLNLDFFATAGTFQQVLTVFSSTWFYLPGDKKHWPVSVTINGDNAPVIYHNGLPAIELNEGKHTIAGKFKWTKIPQSFSIRKSTGLVSLRINGIIINDPFIDKTGKLWIQKKTGGESEIQEKDKNIISTRIFRLVEDTIPIQIHTLIRITVSGERRREKFISCLPEETLAVSVKTMLPVKLVGDGSLWVDVRPGQWDIEILNIINSSSHVFKAAKTPYGPELWAFKPYPALRIAKIEGVHPIDPMQSTMPDAWKKFTSYLINKGDVLSLKEIQRGGPVKISNVLNLNREFWLDFDGKGFTIKDNIVGTIGKRTFFPMAKDDYNLGRISINGEDKLVTQLDNEIGVELERGKTTIDAVSRLESFKSGKEFSLGWKSKFQSANGVLHLPPGFRVLGIKGGHALYNSTWIDSWSMLDFFLILVVSFAVGKLFRWWWGIIFFPGLILIAHEAYAPFYIWLILIVITALFKLVDGPGLSAHRGFRSKVISYLHTLAIIALCGISLVFMSIQIRNAVYPQLEKVQNHKHYLTPTSYDGEQAVSESAISNKRMRASSPVDEEVGYDLLGRAGLAKQSGINKYYQLQQQNIATQTGPGIPSWKWKTVSIDFGLASERHEVALWITTPFQNSILSILRVFFLILMVFRLANMNFGKYMRKKNSFGGLARSITLFFAVLFILNIAPANAEIPGPEILSELEKRMTEPHECFPSCAFIAEAKIIFPEDESINKKKQFIEIVLIVNSAIKTAIPLPSGNGTWRLYDMTIDGSSHLAVVAEANFLWTLIPKGVHTIRLRGIAFGQKRFRFSFPLKPAYLEAISNVWNISGINEDNQADNIVQATFKSSSDEEEKENQDKGPVKNSENILSEFLRVKRTLVLGLEWNLVTIVERFVQSQDQQNVIVEIPLLKDELIRTENSKLSVEKGIAIVNMASDVNIVEWHSSIPISSTITLELDKNAKWAEIWELRQSSMWHSVFSGTPVIYPDEHTSGSFWYPWPGEKLSLTLKKLESAPGESMTIDSVKADYYIGKGYNRIVLNTKIRTTSGRSHKISSPENTVIERITINGEAFPLSGNPKNFSLPLQPGTQAIEIEWNESEKWQGSWLENFFIPRKISFPYINLGQKLNNIDVYMHLPERQWLLFTHGPKLGPAVLAWSIIAVVFIAAFILGSLRVSPLSTIQWIILGLGLVSLRMPEIILVVCWFIAMEIRKEKSPLSPVLFNLTQILLVLWTMFVVITLFKAISNGLIGIPDMQLAGNFSSAERLHWTIDHSSGVLPMPWVITYSIYIYQLFMLAWALWLALNIISWARLGISAMKSDGIWRQMSRVEKRGKLKK